MAGYLFYPTADAVQDRIWKDTVERWGEAQAVAYLTDMHAYLQRLSERRSLWRPLPQSLIAPVGLEVKAYYSRFQRHYIFFRELPAGNIGIMSILHERMDLPVRLAEDLARLSELGSKL